MQPHSVEDPSKKPWGPGGGEVHLLVDGEAGPTLGTPGCKDFRVMGEGLLVFLGGRVAF